MKMTVAQLQTHVYADKEKNIFPHQICCPLTDWKSGKNLCGIFGDFLRKLYCAFGV